jgi:hypothetical protein
MDRTPTQNLGDIAVHWPSGTIYAGTGENNSSRSSYAGIGILKSVDKGKTWSFAGLPDSHHIGRIQIHPDRPEEVVVSVLGHLYSPNEERGIYKTTDGGKTWNRTLYVNDNTGMSILQGRPTIRKFSLPPHGNGIGKPGISREADRDLVFTKVQTEETHGC